MPALLLHRLLLAIIVLSALPTLARGDDTQLPNLHLGSRGWAVGVAQSLLNDSLPAKRRLEVDGILGPKTAAAIEAFKTMSQISDPGANVDPVVWKRLFGDHSKYVLRFEHVPSVVDDKSTPLREDYYQSTVTLWSYDGNGGSQKGAYRGSILPQNTRPNARPPQGRIADGVYDIQLGFHRRSNAAGKAVAVSAEDMRVKFSSDPDPYVRPCLVVARDGVVKVNSSNPNKRTATYIHVHDAPARSRSSLGCQTLPEMEYRRFISHFLTTFPELSDWQTPGNPYIGKDIGVLVVETRGDAPPKEISDAVREAAPR